MGSRARALGMSELYFWRSSFLNHSHFVSTAHLEGDLAPDELVKRIKAQVAIHPSLRWTVAEGSTPCFVELDATTFEAVVVHSLSARGWEEVARAEINRGFSPGGWLFRATIVVSEGRRVIVLTFHHAIADGLAGLLLLKAILEGRNASQGQAAPRSIDGSLTTSAWSKAKTAIQAFKDYFLLAPIDVPPEEATPLRMRKADFLAHHLTTAQTDRLLSWSKVQGVTAHSTLCALALTATLRRIEGDRMATHLVGCCSPINLRSFLPGESRDDVGCYITSYTTFHRFSGQTPLRDLAADARRQLGDAIRNNHGPNYLAVAKFLRLRYEDDAATERAIARYCKFATSVSNKGLFTIACDAPGVKVDRLCGLSSAALLGKSTIGLSATTTSGRMDLAFVYVPGMVSHVSAQRFRDDVLGQIDGLA